MSQLLLPLRHPKQRRIAGSQQNVVVDLDNDLRVDPGGEKVEQVGAQVSSRPQGGSPDLDQKKEIVNARGIGQVLVE